MPRTPPEQPGYRVTLEVLVPAERAQRMVDRLDHRWRIENWTPEGAAYEVAREALEAGGPAPPTHGGVTEARRGAGGSGGAPRWAPAGRSPRGRRPPPPPGAPPPPRPPPPPR